MRHLGAVEAMNLDGGGSTTMVVHGRVVNHPSDGHERGVTSSILVLRRALSSAPRAPGNAPALPVSPSGSWGLAEHDPGSTGGLLDAMVHGAFGPSLRLSPELREIVRRYRSG
jgi:hypothetical protein